MPALARASPRCEGGRVVPVALPSDGRGCCAAPARRRPRRSCRWRSRMIRPASLQAHLLWVPGSTKQRRPAATASRERADGSASPRRASRPGNRPPSAASTRPGTSRTSRSPSALHRDQPGRQLRQARRGRARRRPRASPAGCRSCPAASTGQVRRRRPASRRPPWPGRRRIARPATLRMPAASRPLLQHRAAGADAVGAQAGGAPVEPDHDRLAAHRRHLPEIAPRRHLGRSAAGRQRL